MPNKFKLWELLSLGHSLEENIFLQINLPVIGPMFSGSSNSAKSGVA